MKNVTEDLYVLYNPKAKALYRAQSWGSGRPTMELKTWKTLAGATKALSKLQKPGVACPLEIKLLDVRDLGSD